MAHFQDLSECFHLPHSEGLGFKAVGWLERGRAYTQGAITLEFFEKLLTLLQNPWAPFATAGVHRCEFCRFSGGGMFRFRDYSFSGVGNGYLFVPSKGTLSLSPSSIAHYIDAHEYCPPSEFQKAVIACPKCGRQHTCVRCWRPPRANG